MTNSPAQPVDLPELPKAAYSLDLHDGHPTVGYSPQNMYDFARAAIASAVARYQEALESALEFISDYEDVRDGDAGPLPNREMSLATELRALLSGAVPRPTEPKGLTAEEIMPFIQGTSAPRPMTQGEPPLNGMPATIYHDEGAAARCDNCGRYTMDRKALDSKRRPKCECGETDYWCGSFKRPAADALWSGAVPSGGKDGASELVEAASQVLAMCDSVGDFRNGVTDSTGTIDEGNVIAGRVLERLRAALSTTPASAEQQVACDPLDALKFGANVAESLLKIGRAIGFGRAQKILGEQWDAEHDCAPRGSMGVTAPTTPAPESALPHSYTGSTLETHVMGAKVTFHFSSETEAEAWHESITTPAPVNAGSEAVDLVETFANQLDAQGRPSGAVVRQLVPMLRRLYANASPSREPEQCGWIDEFGNVFPMAAHKAGRTGWMDNHKAKWQPVYRAILATQERAVGDAS